MGKPSSSQKTSRDTSSSEQTSANKLLADSADDEPIQWSEAELSELRFGNQLGCAFAAASCAVYVRTMHPTVAGGDSGELMGAACELGVAHPPGYPLFTMISWLGTQILPFGSPGYRLNLTTVAFAVAAALLQFHAVLRWHLGLLNSRRKKIGNDREWIGSSWVAFFSAGLLAFCPLIWMYSTHAEVFAMNNMFVGLLMYLTIRYMQERDTSLALAGCFSIGLGLSNQHTLVLYALPLAGWMLWVGRPRLLRPAVLGQLLLCGILGLTPYLYLFWAATHAPLGSWGDTSSFSGWPAVGFWTHFLRKEYGTFSLYSGGGRDKSQLYEAMTIYFRKFMSDTLYLGAAAPVGIVAALWRGGAESYAAVVLTWVVTYMLIFHSLSNLPLDKPLFLGVHMRFWMQANMVMFGFVAVGLQQALALVRLWRPIIVIPAILSAVALQIGVNFEQQDQSANYHTYNFELCPATLWDIKKMAAEQGDLVTNSIRYLQRCEKARRDVIHLDMPMMTYEWFRTMHGPHLPGIVFPGVQFAVGGVRLKEHRKCCSYSMKQMLDANAHDPRRPVYMVGGWYGTEMPDSRSPVGVPGYIAEQVGTAQRITPVTRPMSFKQFIKETEAYQPPELPSRIYDETTWEWTIIMNYISYGQAMWVQRLERAVARGKDAEGFVAEQGEIRRVIAGLEANLAMANTSTAGRDDSVLDDTYRNLGIAYGRLKCARPDLYPKVDCEGQRRMREMMAAFLKRTKKPAHEVANERLIIENPDKFVNLA